MTGAVNLAAGGTTPTPTPASDSSSKIATTQFVQAAIAAMPSGGGSVANPTAKVGLTAVNGSAGTAIRADGAPALDQGIWPTWTGKHFWSSTLSGTDLNAPVSINVYDTLSNTNNWIFHFALNTSRASNSGPGHREAMDVRINSGNAASNEFVVGAQFAGHLTGGSGMCFGLNSWADAIPGCDQASQVISYEANTKVTTPVTAKVGIQIVDVQGSTNGAVAGGYDAGIIIGCQAGGAGYSTGIRFGFNGTNGFGIYGGGSLIACSPTGNSIAACLLFDQVTNCSYSPIVLAPGNKGIYWGLSKQGGSVVSETASGGGDLIFASGVTAFRFNNGTPMARFGSDGMTFLTFWDGVNFYLRRLTCGGPDSAGNGYRSIRIEN